MISEFFRSSRFDRVPPVPHHRRYFPHNSPPPTSMMEFGKIASILPTFKNFLPTRWLKPRRQVYRRLRDTRGTLAVCGQSEPKSCGLRPIARAIPNLQADPVIDPGRKTKLPPKVWENVLQVRAAVLDTVRHLAKPGRIYPSVSLLRNVPKNSVRSWIAEILRDRLLSACPKRVDLSLGRWSTFWRWIARIKIGGTL